MTATVVHVISGLGVGGAERMLIRLVEASRGSGLAHRVVSLRAGGELRSDVERVTGATVAEIGVSGALASPAAAWRLRARVKDLRPDAIMGWMYHGNLAAWFARGGTPMIWNIRHSIYDLAREKVGTALAIRAGAFLSPSARTIVYNSSIAARQHEALGYSAESSRVIPNGFDLGHFRVDEEERAKVRARLRLGPDAVAIGLIARVHPLKGHDHFMSAADQTARTGVPIEFILVGTGTEQYLDKWRRTHPDARLRIRALGEIADVASVLPGLDVVVSSSISEAFPNAIGEAMACGIPCIVTDVGDSAELVGEGGRVVPAANPEALGAEMLACAQMSPEHRRAIGALGRRRVEQRFALTVVAAEYGAMFERVLGGRA